MENVHHTLKDGERVSSTYAEIYFDDDYCEHKVIKDEPPSQKLSKKRQTIVSQFGFKDDWASPSDLLIGIIQLTPPFTSKITRGIAHEGILHIGNSILANERAKFDAELSRLLHDNEAAWIDILALEKQKVEEKVKSIYQKIFETKSNILSKEISLFYENTLQELEDHMRSEVQHVLAATHADIVSNLNTEIQQKLQKEKKSLEKRLEKQYLNEVTKIKTYYNLLLNNELHRNKKLVNRALHGRNDALHAFYKQIEAEMVTSTMYVMSLERKKCKIKQFLLENHHTVEIKENIQRIKEKQEILEAYKERERHIADINLEWECKIKKIVELFLKFISYSLKLLPEQSTFLLELEKMVVLQLNEIQKQPNAAPSILVDASDIDNIFSFEQPEVPKVICDKKPFVIVGDTSDPVPPRYGSRETLSSEVDLPTIRLQRQYLYAKCHKYEEIKAFLESQRCKCHDMPPKESSHATVSISNKPSEQSEPVESESSNETLPVEDIKRCDHCPLIKCQDWLKRFSFPYLQSYLDFTETNFSRVKTLLGKPPAKDVPPKLIDAKGIAYDKLPFSATTERYHHAETQYSSEEDLSFTEIPECTCKGEIPMQKKDSPHVIKQFNPQLCACESRVLNKRKKDLHYSIKESTGKLIEEMLANRKNSLRNMLHDHPKLLKMLTDESFDFQL